MGFANYFGYADLSYAPIDFVDLHFVPIQIIFYGGLRQPSK